jgi:hypothetical protein
VFYQTPRCLPVFFYTLRFVHIKENRIGV